MIALAAVATVATVWGGCTVSDHNYSMLSLFFDGVPDPNRPVFIARGPSGQDMSMASAHSAFVERRCADCHGTSGVFSFTVSGFSELDSTVCLQCHEEIQVERPHMHGPVAAGACLWCHVPHYSRYEHLLETPSPEMCNSCHQFHLLAEFRTPEHRDLERNCLECHEAHGGDDRYFLKPPEEWGPAESTDDEAAGPAEEAAETAEHREQ